jgi:hypothetical protein
MAEAVQRDGASSNGPATEDGACSSSAAGT